MMRKHIGLILLVVLLTSSAFSKVKLPALVSNGMVLQRDTPLKIWGWADIGEKVTISFNHKTYSVTTPNSGKWTITLHAISAGGPYSMLVKGQNEIKINDILIGDVWLCSGQSNMAFKMDRIKGKYAAEIADSDNPNIRQFQVATSWNFALQDDVKSDGWRKANPMNVLEFTAVGYFYAKAVQEKLKIPIGIINSSYSATVAEAWISEQGLKNFPEFVAETNLYKDPDKVQAVLDADNEIKSKWFELAKKNDKGLTDKQNTWAAASVNLSDWGMVEVPGYWNNTDIKNMPGVVWMVKEIEIPTHMKGKDASLFFGAIDDRDDTYFNEERIGHSYMKGRAREYAIKGSLIKADKNRITVRIVNPDGPGGFYPDKENFFKSGGEKIDLSGSWKYKIGTKLPALKSSDITKFNCKASAIYNSMIAPLTNYSIKGVVWYQGEGNAGRAYQYRQLFSDLIVDWRNKWNHKDLPFLFVQLANFGKIKEEPAESSWAELREAQSMALKLPATGIAVTHDIGETNDIHPLNKKDVGERLALSAQKVAYNINVISSGPTYKSMLADGHRIIIKFQNIGSGLVARKGKELNHFEIAGEDKKFIWANARIVGDSVEIWSDGVKNPVAVRYAWANSPEAANLYNKEGLPASSFRTDDWNVQK